MEQFYGAAILSLKPGSEFTIVGHDLDAIQWHIITGAKPTKAAIIKEAERLQAEEAARVAALPAEREALLARLGITQEEVKLLLG